MKKPDSPKKKKLKTIIKVLKILSVFSLVSLVTLSSNVSAASQTLPMEIRAANSGEITTLESAVAPTVLPQTGPAINSDFSESFHTVHTGRAWAATIRLSEVPECVSDVNLSIIGNMTVTHVANNTDPLPTPGDQPEMGITWSDGANNLIGTVVGNINFAVGSSVSVTSSTPLPASVATLNSGVKLLFYVETRDDTSQDGAQASFSYAGTPQIKMDYDDTACPAPVTISVLEDTPVAPGSSNEVLTTPAAPKTGIFSATRIIIIVGVTALLLGVGLDIRRHRGKIRGTRL